MNLPDTSSNPDNQLWKDFRKSKLLKLLIAVLLDVIGMLTYTVPVAGEIADLVWAPISGVLNYVIFGGVTGASAGVFTFFEEILPGTDFIPSFTVTWAMKYIVQEQAAFTEFKNKKII
jgi:hypothetical protein